MAQYPKTESIVSIGSIILAILEVQVCNILWPESAVYIRTVGSELAAHASSALSPEHHARTVLVRLGYYA